MDGEFTVILIRIKNEILYSFFHSFIKVTLSLGISFGKNNSNDTFFIYQTCINFHLI